MTSKHPERRPVGQVEGAIRIDPDSTERMYIRPADANALIPLIQVLAKTAERTLTERNERMQTEESVA